MLFLSSLIKMVCRTTITIKDNLYLREESWPRPRMISEHTSPAKPANEFLQKAAVANGNGDRYGLTLIVTSGNCSSVKVVLVL